MFLKKTFEKLITIIIIITIVIVMIDHPHHHQHLLRSFNLIAPQYLGLPTCKETQKWQQLLVRKKLVKISDDFEKLVDFLDHLLTSF